MNASSQLNALFLPTDSVTRAITPENPTGEPGGASDVLSPTPTAAPAS